MVLARSGTIRRNDPWGPASGRLLGIDVLRGLAALGVVLYHAQGGFAPDGLPGAAEGSAGGLPARLLTTALSFGYTGVFLFFVVSGFCIHMRWARAQAAGQTARVEFLSFWKRRIRRLYPPYLVALALYVGLQALRGDWRPTAFNGWDLGLHLLMGHNLDPRTVYTINTVFWTLALEEQLYLAYFLLLWLRTRLAHWGWVLAVCLVVRLAWFAGGFVLHRAWGLEVVVYEAALANSFVWALGAVAVEAALGLIQLPGWSRNGPLAAALLLLGAVLACLERQAPQGLVRNLAGLAATPVWGTGFFVVLNRLVAWEQTRSQDRPVLAVRLLAGLGLFSYSLYLTHELAVTELPRLVSWWSGTPWPLDRWTPLLALAPLSILIAWGFFLAFERPFLSSAARRRGRAASPAVPPLLATAEAAAT